MIIRDIAETYRVSSSPRKRAKVAETGENEGVDRISSLPDVVLIQILSLLQTKDAVKMLMIPSLGRLWDQTFNLDFDWCAIHSCSQISSGEVNYAENFDRFVAFMDGVMRLHRSPRLYKFCLKIDYAIDYLMGDRELPRDPEVDGNAGIRTRLTEALDLWLDSVVRKNVEVFNLDFIACGVPGFYEVCRYILPASVLRSSSLVEMRVAGCGMKCYPGSCMNALKRLYLKDIYLTDDLIDSILSACPVLETLCLENCYGFRRVNCQSQRLQTVMVSPDNLSETVFEVAGPYIKSLSISGWVERVNLGNLPSLHDATIDITDHFCVIFDDYVSIRRIFEKLSHAKQLTMHDQPILVTMIWETLDLQFPSTKWQCLVLKTMLNKWHLPGIANLLRSSPSLETLEIHIGPGELPHDSVQKSWLSSEFYAEEYWTPEAHSFGCLRNSLKTVKISGDVMKTTTLQLVRFLLANSLVLEELTVFTGTTSRSTNAKELNEYKSMVFNLPIASPVVAVKFC